MKTLIAVFALCLLAKADSVTVTGTGHLGGMADSFNFTGRGLQAFSTLPDGPEALGIVAIGSPVTLSWACQTYPGLAYTQVSDGTYTDILTGLLQFSGTIIVPIQANGTFTAPVAVIGSFQSFRDNSLGTGTWNQGPLLANINFSGSGLATFQGCVLANNTFRIISASVDFSDQGTVASVPEPSSWIFLSTGLASLGLLTRRFNH